MFDLILFIALAFAIVFTVKSFEKREFLTAWFSLTVCGVFFALLLAGS